MHPSPPWPRPRPRRRPFLHLALLGATAWTLALSGWLTWLGGVEEVARAGGALEVAAAVARAALRPDVLLAGAPYALAVLAILGAHEMGHWVACRRYGIPATLPFFLPGIVPFGTFGAVIRVRGVVPHRKALFDVAAAGPLAGFVVALATLALGTVEGPPPPLGRSLLVEGVAAVVLPHRPASLSPIGVAGWFGMLVTSLNLFPVGQLDGGHAAYAVSRRLHRWLARGTVAAMIVFVATRTIGGPGPSPYVLWTVVLVFLRDRHPPLADETSPLGGARIAVAGLLAALFAGTFLPVPF